MLKCEARVFGGISRMSCRKRGWYRSNNVAVVSRLQPRVVRSRGQSLIDEKGFVGSKAFEAHHLLNRHINAVFLTSLYPALLPSNPCDSGPSRAVSGSPLEPPLTTRNPRGLTRPLQGISRMAQTPGRPWLVTHSEASWSWHSKMPRCEERQAMPRWWTLHSNQYA